MIPRTFSATLVVFVLLLSSGLAGAQTTYQDNQGRFVIDLPEGWQLAPQTDDNAFVFKGDGKSIIIEYVPGTSDPGELMKKAESSLRASGLTNPVPERGGFQEMSVNGHPAQWGVYKSGKLLSSLTGTVALGSDGLYYMSIMAQSAVGTWKDRIEKSFQSIRMPGETLTGVSDVKTSVAKAPEAGKPTPWKGELVALTLPPGWTEKPKPRGFEKEVQGFFMNEKLPGATLMVVCYKGMGMSMGKAFDAGLKSITIPMPGLKPVEARELKLESGKANFAVLRGMVAGQGSEIELVSVVVTTKADRSFTNLILTGLPVYLDNMKSHAVEMARTVR